MPAKQDSTPDVAGDRAVSSSQQSPPTPSRSVATAVMVVALIAIGVAIWALVKSPAEPAANTTQPAVTAQQSDAAKGRVCSAFDIVRKAVSMQTNVDLGPDAVAREAVAANARLATLGGGAYLLSRLDPATPADLTAAVRGFANDIQDIGMNQLVGVPNTDPKVATMLSSAQEGSDRVAQMCK
jgi:hypothetical protein